MHYTQGGEIKFGQIQWILDHCFVHFSSNFKQRTKLDLSLHLTDMVLECTWMMTNQLVGHSFHQNMKENHIPDRKYFSLGIHSSVTYNINEVQTDFTENSITNCISHIHKYCQWQSEKT